MATSDPKPVLVLEDEFLIALDLKEALLDIGIAEVMLAGSVTEALSLIAGSRVAAALLVVALLLMATGALVEARAVLDHLG